MVTLVGEMNPYGSDPEMALFPLPASASGGRLQRILGLSTGAYVRLRRVNLCYGRWNDQDARMTARGLLVMAESKTGFVLLGSKVCGAFDLPAEPFQILRVHSDDKVLSFLTLPHPSGRCRVWNDPASTERAREGWRALLREVES